MFYEICPNCFNEVHSHVCTNCGYDQSVAKKYDAVLPPEQILNARYLIGRVLGKGGFGVTYLAKDLARNKLVAIKECMPDNYAYRDNENKLYQIENNTLAFDQCKENFRYEIASLKELSDNPFVVKVFDCFSENNTEYFVMEYIDGVSLKIISHNQNGKISLSNTAYVFFTIGSALMEIHKKGIIHRDISPENIMIDRDGSVKLIDFGAAKNYFEEGYYKNESIFLKPGFAPPEQYSLDGNQGPWTDIYAMAATFYTIISGKPLIDSTTRLEVDNLKTLSELGCNIPQSVSFAIEKGLALNVNDRYQDMETFFNAMSDLVDYANEIDSNILGIVDEEKDLENKLGSNNNQAINAKMPKIEVQNGLLAGFKENIPDYGFISIGRDVKNTNVALNDSSDISRLHCIVGFDRPHNRFIVIDYSANGTFFKNGNRMMYGAESYIEPNDTFSICNNGIVIKVVID